MRVISFSFCLNKLLIKTILVNSEESLLLVLLNSVKRSEKYFMLQNRNSNNEISDAEAVICS